MNLFINNLIKSKSFFLLVFSTSLVAETHEVQVSSNTFTPRDIVIEAGDTVRWVNTGGFHNVYANDARFRCAQGCDSSGGNGNPSNELWVFEITFHSIENLQYVCQPHILVGMQGSITVMQPKDIGATVELSVENQIVPKEVTVIEGQAIEFKNNNGEHNLVFNHNNVSCSIGCSDDGTNLMSQPTGFPWRVFRVFDQVGEFSYFCDKHNDETGMITVIPDEMFKNGFE